MKIKQRLILRATLLNVVFLSFFLISSCNWNKKSPMSQISVIPYPDSVKKTNEVFLLDNRTKIVIEEADYSTMENMVKYLNTLFIPAIGARLEVAELRSKQPHIYLRFNNTLNLGKEGYHLFINKKGILIESEAPNGIFYGIQTLSQILPAKRSQTAIEIMGVEIYDQPRFLWRGMHLDVSRHYMPVSFIKRYLDFLAMHKLNTFHWHLTDDQGWRIEIKQYPRLTEIGSWREETLIGHYRDQPHQFDGIRYGGFYSQEDIREIVRYAQDRFITIVPEIEMPGHAQAAIAAYPEMGVTGEEVDVRKIWGISPYLFNMEESTLQFIQNILTEVISLFPGTFIHIGGDEAIKDQWKASEQIQEKIKNLDLKDEHALQSWFIQRIDSFLTAHLKRLIGWDEILDDGLLGPNAAIMSWRGEEGGIKAAKSGHDVVMTPSDYCYFDYYQADEENEPLAIGGYLPLSKVYSYEPVPEEFSAVESSHILGVQGNVWTEYLDSPAKVEYMVFPRIAALSEVAWTYPVNKNWSGFQARIEKLLLIYENMEINYSKSGLQH